MMHDISQVWLPDYLSNKILGEYQDTVHKHYRIRVLREEKYINPSSRMARIA